MAFALFVRDPERSLTVLHSKYSNREAWMEGYDIRDVTNTPQAAPGWISDDAGNLSAPPVNPQPAAPKITYKADIYRRCSDAEAEAIEMALASAPVRERRLFESAQYLDHSAEEFASLREAMVQMFGEGRADDLLAQS